MAEGAESPWRSGIGLAVDPMKRLEAIRTLVIEGIVLPRMRELAASFDDVALEGADPAARWSCSCTFRDPSRVAGVLRLTLSLHPDRRLRRAVLSSNVEAPPTPTPGHANDALLLPLEAADPEAIARWVERRILAFVTSSWHLLRKLARER